MKTRLFQFRSVQWSARGPTLFMEIVVVYYENCKENINKLCVQYAELQMLLSGRYRSKRSAMVGEGGMCLLLTLKAFESQRRTALL